VIQSAIAVAGREPVAPVAAAAVTEVCDDLLELFGSVSDGRSDQGRDHRVAAALALAAAAVAAGMKAIRRSPAGSGTFRLWCWRICTCGRRHPGAAVEGDDLAGDHRR
jgi:hypothetical protein